MGSDYKQGGISSSFFQGGGSWSQCCSNRRGSYDKKHILEPSRPTHECPSGHRKHAITSIRNLYRRVVLVLLLPEDATSSQIRAPPSSDNSSSHCYMRMHCESLPHATQADISWEQRLNMIDVHFPPRKRAIFMCFRRLQLFFSIRARKEALVNEILSKYSQLRAKCLAVSLSIYRELARLALQELVSAKESWGIRPCNSVVSMVFQILRDQRRTVKECPSFACALLLPRIWEEA